MTCFLKETTRDLPLVRQLILIAIIAAISQYVLSQILPIILLNDSVAYLGLTHFFPLKRPVDWYAASGVATEYDIFYPYGYPFFLDLISLVVPLQKWAIATIIAQHVLSFLTVLAIYGIGVRVGFVRPATVAACLYAIYVPRVLYAHAIMAETLFTFLLVCSIYLSILAAERKTLTIALASGFLMGLAVLTKPLAFLAALGFCYVFLKRRSGALTIAGFLISLSLVVSGNLVHNGLFYGEWRILTSGGIHLADRVFGYDRFIVEDDPDVQSIKQQLATSDIPHKFPSYWWDYYRALRADGSSAKEVDKKLRRASLAGIRANIREYLLHTFVIMGLNLFLPNKQLPLETYARWDAYSAHLARWVGQSPGIVPPAELEARELVLQKTEFYVPPRKFGRVSDRWAGFFGSPPFTWRGAFASFFIFGFVYSLTVIRRTEVRAIVLISLAIMFGTALLETFVPRYFESLIPLALLVSCISLGHASKWLTRFWFD